MNSLHFSEDTLLDFAIASDELAERAEIEEHLPECVTCRAVVNSYTQFSASLESPEIWELDDVATAVSRADESRFSELAAYATRLDQERAAASSLVEALETFHAEERMQFLATSPELWTAGVVEELRQRAYNTVVSAPSASLQWSELALAVCEKLPADRYEARTIAAVNGRAWVVRARALHFLSRYPEALSALERADRFFHEGSSGAFDLACVTLVRAAVYRDTDRLTDALDLARECGEVFVQFGDQQRFIYARLLEGAVFFKSGELRRAREIWSELLRPARAENDLSTLARLYNNIGNVCLELGESDSAGMYLLQAIPIFEELGLKPDALRSRWTIGRLLLSSNRLSEGLVRLRVIHEEFERLEMVEEAGLVGMDIVEALLRQNQVEEASVICRYLVERFADAGMTANAISAVAYLREALSAGKATPTLAKRVRNYIAEVPRHREQILFAPAPE